MNQIRKLVTLLPAVLVFMCGGPNQSPAAVSVNSWTWGAGGFWHRGTNWSTTNAPGTNADLIQLSASGVTKTIIIDTNSSVTNLTINALLVASAGSKFNWLVVSNLGSARPFTILGGATITGSSTPGRLIVTNSRVVLDGTNNFGLIVSNGAVVLQPGGEIQLTNGAAALLGETDKIGDLTIATNSIFHVADSNFVAGPASGSIGTVTISGGTLHVGWTLTIGDRLDSTGHVIVASGLLRADNTNANTQIGQNGGGQLTLSNGVCQLDDISVGRHLGSHGTFRIYNGLCTGSDLSVGRFDGSYGVFSMAGGQLILSGALFAGRESTGTVSVTGGTIQANEFVAAVTNGTLGTATFSGGTSIFSSAISIGSIGSTGLVTLSGGLFICTNAASTGRVDVMGGSLTVTNSGTNTASVFFDTLTATNQRGRIILGAGSITADQIIISNTLPLTVGGGTNVVTLRLSGGTNVFNNGLIVASNSTVIGDGVIYGNIINNGTILADRTNTTLTFYGSVTNNRTMLQTNGGMFDFRGPLVNNGVIVPNPPPVVSFTAGPTNGLAPLTVFFTNQTSGATNYAWDFGDGKTSAVTNPTNTYTNAASYTVKLTALGAGGSNSLTRTNYIVVVNIPTPSRITDFRRMGTTNRVSFTTISGITYAVEAAITLTNSTWFTITSNFPGNNATNSINDGPATNASRFYRIKGQ